MRICFDNFNLYHFVGTAIHYGNPSYQPVQWNGRRVWNTARLKENMPVKPSKRPEMMVQLVCVTIIATMWGPQAIAKLIYN